MGDFRRGIEGDAMRHPLSFLDDAPVRDKWFAYESGGDAGLSTSSELVNSC